MTIFFALRDFAGGLSRGFSLFVTERNDFTAQATNPLADTASSRRIRR